VKSTAYENSLFSWIIVSGPNEDDVQSIAQEFKIHPNLVSDIFEKGHLPKLERTETADFVMVRVFDSKADPKADTLESLTRKITLIISPNKIYFIQYLSDHCVQSIKTQTLRQLSYISQNTQVFSLQILNEALSSYWIPIEDAEDELDQLEAQLLNKKTNSSTYSRLHILRRRLSLIKRLSLHAQDVIQRFFPTQDQSSPIFQDLKDNLISLSFMTDELLEDVNSLFNLQLSLAGQRTNEVVRVLTIFSVFFMPVTFIVGIYGMNFQIMPELHWQYGYHAVWALMISVTSIIAFWFWRRGWLNFKA